MVGITIAAVVVVGIATAYWLPFINVITNWCCCEKCMIYSI